MVNIYSSDEVTSVRSVSDKPYLFIFDTFFVGVEILW